MQVFDHVRKQSEMKFIIYNGLCLAVLLLDELRKFQAVSPTIERENDMHTAIATIFIIIEKVNVIYNVYNLKHLFKSRFTMEGKKLSCLLHLH